MLSSRSFRRRSWPRFSPAVDEPQFNVVTEKPSGKHWGIVAAWLKENREALDWFRSTAGRFLHDPTVSTQVQVEVQGVM